MKDFGIISLFMLEIKFDGVDQVQIFDVQVVFVLFDVVKVMIKENWNFYFIGWGSVGKLEVYLIDVNYNYVSNKINILVFDCVLFCVKLLSEKDGQKFIVMVIELYGLMGEIQIDDVKNCFGKSIVIMDFLKLKFIKVFKIYYNQKLLYCGVYDFICFYYMVDLFEIDSFDNFVECFMKFNGELMLVGIFLVFCQELKIMNDYFFGFLIKVFIGGYDFYGMKVKYDNWIVLLNNGLQGEGKIDFVQLMFVFKVFIFLLDFMVGYVNFVNCLIEVGVQFLDVNCEEVYVVYVLKKLVFKVYFMFKNDLVFFKGEFKLCGIVFVELKGMCGYGIMQLLKVNLGLDNFKFKWWDCDVDMVIFNLKNIYKEEGEEDLVFKIDNV